MPPDRVQPAPSARNGEGPDQPPLAATAATAAAHGSQTARLLVQLGPRILLEMRAGLRNADLGGLTVPQVRVLRYVNREPDCRLRDLAEHLYISAPSASALMNRLARQGLLRVEVPAEDRRRVRLSLTAAGQAMLARATELNQAALRARLQGLQPQELAAIDGALQRLLDCF
jgi:DNA-binding MarR family transcriptional regulator